MTSIMKTNLFQTAKFTRFNFTFRYIDDVLSQNNSKAGDYVDRIYHIEHEIKDTTNTARSASYILEIDRGPVKNETLRQKRRFLISHF